jgi:hypothetical protein
MPRNIRVLKADLRRAGFVEDARAGKCHQTSWVYRDDPAVKVVFSLHDSSDAPPYLEKQVREALAQIMKERD